SPILRVKTHQTNSLALARIPHPTQGRSSSSGSPSDRPPGARGSVPAGKDRRLGRGLASRDGPEHGRVNRSHSPYSDEAEAEGLGHPGARKIGTLLRK